MFSGSSRVSIFSAAPKFPRDIILSHSPLSDKITDRFVLFTAPTKFDPRGKTVDGGKHQASEETVRGKRTVIYTGIPAYNAVAGKDAADDAEVIFAIATTSTRVMHDDFMPKRYLANTKTMLLLVMPNSDQGDSAKVQRHLSAEYNIRSLVLRVPAEDEQDRKFNVMGSLMEFAAYKEGQGDYYTIIDDDVFIPSYPAFLSAISAVNPSESHVMADESITSSKRSSTPIVITKGLLKRASAGTKWDKCVEAAAKIRYADKKLAKCIQLVQNPEAQSPKIDFIDELLLEETISEPTSLLESGVAPVSMRALFKFGGLPIDEESFADVLFGRLKGFSAESALTKVSLQKGEYDYTHGFSIVHNSKERYFISKAVPFNEPLGKGETVSWLSMLYTTSKGKQVQVDWVLNGNNLDTARGK
ncbi:hypothetical protein BCR37DRAFT_391280 [Protomyces lactucae-debilis]|uniref:Uncharacterized protein n=1 Tax=Protomyces lactucae-debilis TaxID=2754530 RepID=A0A1Y2FS22_PROLT|nr:uncharacterized protein BCR37DRAFT_391280 [Protomyces lactucae-debilis]ORY85505.1 hypothetical protein BCR37DRAFT_391280 [Protomyces lactucae-debilis]